MSQETAATQTGGTQDEERLVTVASFQEPVESNMARLALQAAGIDAILRGDNAGSLIPGAFETQLQVRAEDEAAARAILDDAETSPPSEQEVTAAETAAEQSAG